MAYVDKINVQGTDYDINDKRLPEVEGVVTLNGDFTANEIVEKMSGYSAGIGHDLNWDANYIGVCKNGNKITFVIFGSYTYATDDDTHIIVDFNIPADIGSKLIPYSFGGFADLLALDEVAFFDDLTSNKKLTLSLRKGSNTTVQVAIRSPYGAGLTNGTTYYFRYERTFLLSENLAA